MRYEKFDLKADIMMGAALVAGFLLLPRSCTAVVEQNYDATDAVATAEDMGFTDAEVTEVNRWYPGFQGCDEKDSIGFELNATNPNGDEVDLLVCKGLFKGATIRQK